ncbi:BTB/POZ domain protein, partial [Teladorsagia circumcincta]
LPDTLVSSLYSPQNYNRQYNPYGTMSSALTNSHNYDAYSNDSNGSTGLLPPITEDSVKPPIARERSKSPLARVWFADTPTPPSSRRKLKSALWRIGANVKLVIRKKDGERFVERNTETIPDVSAEDFLELLNVVYPSQKPVTVENVETLLKLGDRYAFECVLVKCENFLITSKADEIDVFTRLEWASKYAMADLQDHCVSKLTNAAAVGAVKKTLLYGSLSHETRKLLLELMLKFSNM